MKLSVLKSKIEQAFRLLLVNSITPYNGSILIVEYPKSGGTWLGQLISDYMGLPFPRNRMPTVKQAVFHSHYLPKWRIPKNKKIVYLVRDGRDVIISLYYHQLIWNEKNRLNPKDVLYHREQTNFDDFENITDNLSSFIEYTFTDAPTKWQHFTYMGNWAGFNNRWLAEMQGGNKNLHILHYEDLLEDTIGTMDKLLKAHLDQKSIDTEKLHSTVEKYSFENQSKRKKGQEKKDSFLRKGIAGDWKNYFGPKEKESFKRHTGDLLIRLGYEKDMNW